ncbi:MAG: hypothetical protein QXJ61_02950 [Candidatus Nitrosocaldus sp.]
MTSFLMVTCALIEGMDGVILHTCTSCISTTPFIDLISSMMVTTSIPSGVPSSSMIIHLLHICTATLSMSPTMITLAIISTTLSDVNASTTPAEITAREPSISLTICNLTLLISSIPCSSSSTPYLSCFSSLFNPSYL